MTSPIFYLSEFLLRILSIILAESGGAQPPAPHTRYTPELRHTVIQAKFSIFFVYFSLSLHMLFSLQNYPTFMTQYTAEVI
jgi:hypothetical protein